MMSSSSAISSSTITQGAGPFASPARHNWMDMSRGLAVLLVVLVHSGSIYGDMSQNAVPGSIRALDLAFAPYRMPFLVFLSGIFLSRSLAKGLIRFTLGKIKNLLWPFLVWTLIIVASLEGPSGWLDWRVWLTGAPTLWYLSFLLVFYAVGLLLARLPVLLVAGCALAISVVAPDETRYGERLFVLMAYFFIGAFAGQHLERFHRIIKARWTLGLLPLMLGLSIYMATQADDLKYSPFLVPLILPSIICMSNVINTFSSGSVAAALQFAGRHSLVYYVVHPPIYFLFYPFMADRGLTNPYLCIGVALLLAVATATFVAHVRPHSRAISYLFEGPDFPRLSPSLAALAGRLERILLPAHLLKERRALQGRPSQELL